MSEIGSTNVEDTPVNGHTTIGISSNWAFDENAALRTLIEATLPWLIDIDCFLQPKSHVNWNTILIDSYLVNNVRLDSSGAQNDEIAWDIVLAAGTWTLSLIGYTNTNIGIYTIIFDSVSKGTIDGYSAGPVLNTILSLTGIVVPTTAKIELKLKMATKNGSASAYIGRLIGLRLIRTA